MHLRKEIRAKQRRETRFAEALVAASKTITGTLARILHQAAHRIVEFDSFVLKCFTNVNDCRGRKLRWPRPRLSFAVPRAHAPSTIGGAMLSVASRRGTAKSGAIIATLGAICGLASQSRTGCVAVA